MKFAFLLILNICLISLGFGGEYVDLLFDKAFYHPEETITITIDGFSKQNDYRVEISQGIKPIKYLNLDSNKIQLKAPSKTGGYGIDLFVENKLVISRGFEVLNHWTESPKYGFLTDFSPGRVNIEKTMNYLTQYHINGIQYYDWMYDYGDLVYEKGDIYRDAWSRNNEISNSKLKELINAAKRKNISSMAYVAIYSINIKEGLLHPDWLLYKNYRGEWKPVDFLCEKILLTNTLKNSGWTAHLINECKKTIEFGFDGIHLDQYGYPKDWEVSKLDGEEYIPYKTSEGFKQFINSLKNNLDCPVVFNYVDNWPKAIQGDTDADFIYIEPWESCNTYLDLFKMLDNANKDSNGKSVVLAAYIKGAFQNSILFAEAVTAIAGGSRLEIGEIMRILSGPYFPNADITTTNFLSILRNYYDFQVRYKNFLKGDNREYLINSSNFKTSAMPKRGNVWTSVIESNTGIIINLVNLVNLKSDNWREYQSRPEKIKNLVLEIPFDLVNGKSDFFFTSPDDQLKPLKLEPIKKANSFLVTVPFLHFWSAIIVK